MQAREGMLYMQSHSQCDHMYSIPSPAYTLYAPYLLTHAGLTVSLLIQALTLFLCGALKPVRFIMYSIAHLLAGIAACAVLAGILPGPLTIACRLSNGTSVVQGLFIGEPVLPIIIDRRMLKTDDIFVELFLTCFLCFTVCLAAIEKHRATHICAIAIGMALFSTQLLALTFTGAAVNTGKYTVAAS